MCTEVRLRRKSDNLYIIDTPFTFSDGDSYQLFLAEMPTGLVRITDNGHTLIHLSYENDITKFRSGTRGMLFDQILIELEVKEEDGEIFIVTSPNDIIPSIFKLSKAIIQISDLTFLNRLHAENTFYEDLRESIFNYVDSGLIQVDYLHPGIPNSKDYPIDYYIAATRDPLVVFGIPNKDKAKLATIILERLTGNNIRFESLLVFYDQTSIPKGDIARLSNVGGEMISSLDAQEDLRRKLLKRVGHDL
jgi:hypothetical protein